MQSETPTLEQFNELYAEGYHAGRRWAIANQDSPTRANLIAIAAAAGIDPVFPHNEAADRLEGIIGAGIVSIPVNPDAAGAVVEGFVAGAAFER